MPCRSKLITGWPLSCGGDKTLTPIPARRRIRPVRLSGLSIEPWKAAMLQCVWARLDDVVADGEARSIIAAGIGRCPFSQMLESIETIIANLDKHLPRSRLDSQPDRPHLRIFFRSKSHQVAENSLVQGFLPIPWNGEIQPHQTVLRAVFWHIVFHMPCQWCHVHWPILVILGLPYPV